MLVGREEQLAQLQKMFGKLTSSIVVLYGKKGMGKTSLAREFIKDKDSFYYYAIPAAPDEARFFMANAVYGPSELNGYLTSYEDVFVGVTKENKVKKVIVIDEFQSICRNDPDFLKAAFTMIKDQQDYGRVMLILISSSISFIEEQQGSLFKEVRQMTSYMKLEELKFMDTIRFFANYSIEDCVRFYGLTGGVPLYISKLSKKLPFKENVYKAVLTQGSFLYNEGHASVGEELRETALYNTILGCLASGMNKINDIYNYTGFGRDKISVYLKNLMARDIVEKVYSYDVNGRENIKKGSYRIKPGFVLFWYRYMYQNQTELVTMQPQDFYNEYIADDLDDFMNEAFVNVCSDYLQLLEEHGGVAMKTVRKSRVYEKNLRIDIIREDEEGVCAVGQCDFSGNQVLASALTELKDNVRKANLNAIYYFMFSRAGFADDLKKIANDDKNIILVDIKDL